MIATTNRDEICNDESWDLIDKGDTLYVLKDLSQELCAPAEERVNYLPHYDTIVKGGMYEYYASEGQNPLPYAFAELIDNSLAATACNEKSRDIEVRLHFDDSAPQRSCIIVIDNGKGMTPRQLNNWAIYRLSKFIRREKNFKGEGPADESVDGQPGVGEVPVARYMNSDISYFGVGGKQAIFFIGNSTRMISRPKGSKDVHELIISKEEFEKREKNNEAIYSGFIRNRQPGDASHLGPDEETVSRLIAEETERDAFTAVVIQSVEPSHISYLKQHAKVWTRQLAHIYHFYLHGPDGNQDYDDDESAPIPPQRINIEVKLYLRGQPQPKVISLRRIQDDMQTLYARSTANTFEFKAIVDGLSAVEGMLRYHPFLYDRETFPSDAFDPRIEPEPEDDHGYAINEQRARGKRAIFECYWNGRLIPYTLIEDFDWCALPKKNRSLPTECYNRISGVLWTNDSFQVSTNKLTFLDLEMKLRDKNTVFTRVVNSHDKRTQIDKEFAGWLKECHEKHDKQIFFSGFIGVQTRSDLPRHKQYPWSYYMQVEWDGRTYKQGDMVRIHRASAPLFGRILSFMLYGDNDGDVYSTGGELEITQEPVSVFDEVKVVPLTKLDRTVSQVTIRHYIEEEEAKLPSRLDVTWPNGMEVEPNEKRSAGKTIGDLKIHISNRKGEHVSKLPGSAAKKLLVELKVIWHGPQGDEVIVSHISQHGKNWPYWFRKMENLKNLGDYTIQLQAVLNESGATTYAGHQLPSHTIKFSVVEGEPEKFSVGLLDGPFKVGVPFNIPLEFQDKFRNPTKPPSKVKVSLSAEGLELTYDNVLVKASSLLVRGVVAKGAVTNNSGKNFSLVVVAEELKDSQTMKIRLLPGPPVKLVVTPEEEVTLENGSSASFDVQVLDAAGNATNDGKQIITVKFLGAPGLPVCAVNCSSTGVTAIHSTPITVKKLEKNAVITARLELQGQRTVPAVERKLSVVPSGRITCLQVFRELDKKEVLIDEHEEIVAVAGEYIKGLRFKLLDEGDRELEITDKIADRVRVNWMPKLTRETVKLGQLPVIRAPTSMTETKFCNVSIVDNGIVESPFSVKATAGEVARLACNMVGDTHVCMGETSASVIMVTLTDEFGNLVKLPPTAVKELKVTSEHLAQSKVTVTTGEGKLLIQNIQFDTQRAGVHRVTLAFRGLEDSVVFEVVAGPPVAVDMPEWDPEMPVTVYTESALPFPIKVQLLDRTGNPSHMGDVRVFINKDPKMKLFPAPQPLKTNSEGVVDFGIMTISGPSGVYDFQVKATFGRTVLCGPKIRVSIQPDPMKPRELQVDYNKKANFIVGQKLPDFTVKVVAEDDSLLNTTNPSHLSMKIWKADNARQNTPPSRAQHLSPDTPGKASAGVFTFRNHTGQEQAGSYNVMFVYFDGKHEVYSSAISVTLEPGPPTKLVPLQAPGMPTVSNTRSASSRCLLRSLKLQLQDEFNNPVAKGYDGEVTVALTRSGGILTGSSGEMPMLVGGTRTMSVNMKDGQSTLQNMTIQENSPGKDGMEYALRCTVSCSQIPRSQSIPHFIIPFLFYNDAKKQSQMAALSKERENLQSTIQAYRSMFQTQRTLVEELRTSVHEAAGEEQSIRAELRKQNIPGAQLQDTEAVQKLIAARTKERDQLLNTPRRQCGLNPAPNEPEVIGKIGHLALIENPDIARVISWHMSADMDCVITHTTKKAQEIYSKTQGRQQVLPLDSIYRKNLPDWGKPLPHVRYRPNWKPPGRPVYARDLLHFTAHQESCQLVFGMLLGDTLILDSLDNANMYRQEIIKHSHCPTILTWQGDRIRSNGKFGGTMNKAVPLERLRGAVFGEPLPIAYHALCTQIASLESYLSGLMRHVQAQDELQEVINAQKNPEMAAKYKECREAEAQLTEVERQLGVGVPSKARPASSLAKDTAGPSPSKRARTSPGAATSSPIFSHRASLNGSGEAAELDPSITPTRTSLRIASMTPVVSDDGRKRLRKTRLE